MVIRDATSTDFPAILSLNHESVHFLSAMDEKRLVHLHAQRAYHRVATAEEVLGFLLAFADGADYDSENYRWFSAKYPKFLYIDRVVVARQAQGRGVGRTLYTDLFAFAAQQGYDFVTCEFDIDPPNPVSAEFHRSFGFLEVGRQRVARGKKMVSMQAISLLNSRRP